MAERHEASLFFLEKYLQKVRLAYTEEYYAG
jgi:hypothetical protein